MAQAFSPYHCFSNHPALRFAWAGLVCYQAFGLSLNDQTFTKNPK
jgi:hypothetical protein